MRKELRKHFRVLELVGAIPLLDDQAIHSLRKSLITKEFIGEPPEKPQAGPILITNQQAFEQYHRMVEADLRSPVSKMEGMDTNPYLFGIIYYAQWSSRYLRRKNTIDGSYGKLADVPAQRALVARNRAQDAAEKEIPAWDPSIREVIDLCMKNPVSEVDAHAIEDPHGFGPSIRSLWAEARRAGLSEDDCWQSLITWARRRPEAWQAEDNRKKKGKIAASPALGKVGP